MSSSKDILTRSQSITDILDTVAAAAMIGCSPATLQKWRWEGKGPRHLKISKLVRYRRSELERFLAEAERRSTSDSGGQA